MQTRGIRAEKPVKNLPALAGGEVNHIPDGFDERADALDSEARPGQREDLTPDAYGEHVEDWLGAGADIVGGCCEVGPDHIAHLRTVADEAARGCHVPG
jgi:S-methylmethionine-dependent homocysteine/selenocysteine methylase